jgi:hypothetical protein
MGVSRMQPQALPSKMELRSFPPSGESTTPDAEIIAYCFAISEKMGMQY